MTASNGITGKAGRWSARHPWTAISLWIAFAALSMVIGNALGTKQLTESESASGESGVAARTLDKAGFKLQPGEQVIVQSKTLEASDPAFRAVVTDVMKRASTLVRAVLLPATMKLLGDKNWYLPKKLSRPPRVSHGTPVASH